MMMTTDEFERLVDTAAQQAKKVKQELGHEVSVENVFRLLLDHLMTLQVYAEMDQQQSGRLADPQ